MADLDVSYDKIQAAADRITLIRADLQASLDRSRQRVDGLIGCGFQTDTASETYEDQFTKFADNTDSAIQELDGIHSFLLGVIGGFSDTDSSLASPMSN